MVKNIRFILIISCLCVLKSDVAHAKNSSAPLYYGTNKDSMQLQVRPISLINMPNVPINMTSNFTTGEGSTESFVDILASGIKGIYYGYQFIKNVYPYFVKAKNLIENLPPETLASFKNIKIDLHSLVDKVLELIDDFSIEKETYRILKMLSQ